MLGLLLRTISIIVEIFILTSNLQRFLSMFERMSMFFYLKMTVVSAPNEIFFQALYKLWKSIPPTDLSKKIPCNCCKIYQRKFHVIVAISTFVRVLKNSLQTTKLVSRG